MSKIFQVGIYSSDQILYEGEAISLMVPSVLGYLGVLAGHAPLIAKLSSGKITIQTRQGNTRVIDSSVGGFLQVLHNQATILL
jgi:F-type H+-transporting ATPase subunit epsilon